MSAGLTQADLARRLGTTQSAVARLERNGSNPRLSSLRRAMEAMGRCLEISARHVEPSVDESMIAANLRLSPAERLAHHQRAYDSIRDLTSKARVVTAGG
jgi:transcriptional regulator with XRE-family HTH domain